MDESTILIGELARRTGVKVTTIRFYERQGLLPAPERRGSGYRTYPLDMVNRIRFIHHAQALGFTLDETKELLSLRLSPEVCCDDIHEVAESKLVVIRSKIHSLQRMERILSNLAAQCRQGAPANQCPILDALDNKKIEHE